MAVKQEPRNGVWYDWLLGDNNWHTNMNTNLKQLGLKLYLSAISRSVSTPPGSPTNGDAYLVGPSPSGAWVGHTNDVAIWVSADSAWTFYAPKTGFLCNVQDENFLAKWSGTAWVTVEVAAVGEDVVINGRFDFWQEGTSQTSSGYGSDCLWRNEHSGSAKTHSRQAFALGQTAVPGAPDYFSRTVVTSAAGVANYVRKTKRFEQVASFGGRKVTFSIWAKADAVKNVAVEAVQNFGTGGTPSAEVTATGVTTLGLTASWQRFEVAVTFPSVSGKTLGTDGNDYSELVVWFEAGSNYNARTNTLGQQSGTFDLAIVRGVIGAFALADQQWRTRADELAKICRYWSKTYDLETVPGAVTAVGRRYLYLSDIAGADYTVGLDYRLPVRMRAVPSVTVYSDITGASGVVRLAAGDIAPTVTPGQTAVTVEATNGAAATTRQISFHAVADARL
jgi:hypothetical protein